MFIHVNVFSVCNFYLVTDNATLISRVYENFFHENHKNVYGKPPLNIKMIPYFQSFLPTTTSQGGYLPHWLLFISVVSIFNSLQTYQSPDLTLTRRVYESAPTNEVTKLSARTFGTWTFITSIVRFYGAYYLVGNKQIYELCMWSFAVAGGHFISEWLYFGNCKLGKGLAGPLIVSSTSLLWMYLQKDFYLN